MILKPLAICTHRINIYTRYLKGTIESAMVALLVKVTHGQPIYVVGINKTYTKATDLMPAYRAFCLRVTSSLQYAICTHLTLYTSATCILRGAYRLMSKRDFHFCFVASIEITYEIRSDLPHKVYTLDSTSINIYKNHTIITR